MTNTTMIDNKEAYPRDVPEGVRQRVHEVSIGLHSLEQLVSQLPTRQTTSALKGLGATAYTPARGVPQSYEVNEYQAGRLAETASSQIQAADTPNIAAQNVPASDLERQTAARDALKDVFAGNS